MPNPYFVVLELIAYTLFAACLWHAWQRGPHVAWQMLAGVMFGVMLELATIQQLHAYHYGRFLVMVADAPLAVGVAWVFLAAMVAATAVKMSLIKGWVGLELPEHAAAPISIRPASTASSARFINQTPYSYNSTN